MMDLLSDERVGGLKEARTLLPHRSTSTIHFWLKNKNIDAISSGEGTGTPIEFSFVQMVDLVVVDIYSTLGLLAEKYPGRNLGAENGGEGNICEIFEYKDAADSGKIFPSHRSRSNAISYYKHMDFNVAISIDLMRIPPTRDQAQARMEDFLKERQKVKSQRSKVGKLYYNITYFKLTKGNLKEEVLAFAGGGTAGKDLALCLIAVPLVRDYVSRTLGIGG